MTALAGDTSSSSMAARKTALRSHLRAKRVAISFAYRRRAAGQCATRLLRLLGGSRRVAVYLSAHSELSTIPLVAALLRRGRRVYVPMTRRDFRMCFVPLRPGMPLRRSPLGLPQPVSTRGTVSAGAFDAIVLPLLGFDAKGRRLGNGGGYYDRALSGLGRTRRPQLIGYAFAIQQADELPEEPWDIPLHTVVTECGIHRFS